MSNPESLNCPHPLDILKTSTNPESLELARNYIVAFNNAQDFKLSTKSNKTQNSRLENISNASEFLLHRLKVHAAVSSLLSSRLPGLMASGDLSGYLNVFSQTLDPISKTKPDQVFDNALSFYTSDYPDANTFSIAACTHLPSLTDVATSRPAVLENLSPKLQQRMTNRMRAFYDYTKEFDCPGIADNIKACFKRSAKALNAVPSLLDSPSSQTEFTISAPSTPAKASSSLGQKPAAPKALGFQDLLDTIAPEPASTLGHNTIDGAISLDDL